MFVTRSLYSASKTIYIFWSSTLECLACGVLLFMDKLNAWLKRKWVHSWNDFIGFHLDFGVMEKKSEYLHFKLMEKSYQFFGDQVTFSEFDYGKCWNAENELFMEINLVEIRFDSQVNKRNLITKCPELWGRLNMS